MKSNLKAVLTVAIIAICSANSGAATNIDMENLAPAAGLTTEIGTTRAFGGFDLAIPYGHFFDAANLEVGPSRPDNGTDWLMNDWVPPFVPGLSIVRSDGGRFSAISFDATEWDASFAPGTTITATGHLTGGGTTTQQFSTDTSVLMFETFFLNSTFVDLVKLDLVDSGRNPPPIHEEGALAYDNIVVSPVPEPSISGLLVSALLIIATIRRTT